MPSQSPSHTPRFGRQPSSFGCNGLSRTRRIHRYVSSRFIRFARIWNGFGAKAGYVMGSQKALFMLIAFFVAFTIMVRLIPHTANMTPIGALALVAGMLLPRRWGWLVPMGALLISDAFIGGYELPVMMAVYGSVALIAVLGNALRAQTPAMRLVVGPVFSSTLFFLITNFAIWAATPWYPKNIAGLLTSYTLALPFWRNMLVGDIVYTAAFSCCVALAVGTLQRRSAHPSFVTG